jgi:hypothetical protein
LATIKSMICACSQSTILQISTKWSQYGRGNGRTVSFRAANRILATQSIEAEIKYLRVAPQGKVVEIEVVLLDFKLQQLPRH